MRFKAIGILLVFMLSSSIAVPVAASEEETEESFFSELPIEMHGFYEVRGGYRLQNDKYQKDKSIMEGRLQLDLFSYFDWGDVKVKGDALGDLVTEEGDFDLRLSAGLAGEGSATGNPTASAASNSVQIADRTAPGRLE